MNTLPQIRTILYATDLGEHMRPVVRHAICMARQHDAKILMLHVVESLGGTGQAVADVYLPSDSRRQMEQDGLKSVLARMRARIERFYADELGETPTESRLISDIIVHSGRADDEIPRQARERGADLIVMGTCSHGLLGRGLLGSTAARVVQTSRVPVLVVPNCDG